MIPSYNNKIRKCVLYFVAHTVTNYVYILYYMFE